MQPGSTAPFVDERDFKRWIDNFNRTHGRPLRVLHIGNIANNAFRNATVQRRYGIAADVVCYDYHHVMGCPEWELNGLKGDYDPFAPDWWKLRISGPARPEWYIQGTTKECQAMLRARISGSRLRALRARLSFLEAEVVRLRNNGQTDPGQASQDASEVLYGPQFGITRHLAPEIGGLPSGLLRIWRKLEKTRTDGWWREHLDLALAVLRGKPQPSENRDWIIQATQKGRLLTLLRLAGASAAVAAFSVAQKLFPGLTTPPEDEKPERFDPAGIALVRAEQHVIFPDVSPAELESDLAFAQVKASGWCDILKHYDIVQAYSTDGIIPLVCDHPHFLSYEHGTIREIPFEKTQQGRLCWLTYRLSPIVLITNSDVMPSAEKMGLRAEQIVKIPHAFDDGPLLALRGRYDQARRSSQATEIRAGQIVKPVTFFSPARQHWTGGGGSWEKGNDLYLRAAAQLAAEGHSFKLLLVEWGQDVDASKRLIQELGLESRVEWLPLLEKDDIYGQFLSASCVLDQFTLPALGGISYEALTMGARVITRIDRDVLEAFFCKAPPLLDAHSVETIAARMLEVINDPDDRAGVGRASAEWAKTYHSSERMMALHLGAYAHLLAR